MFDLDSKMHWGQSNLPKKADGTLNRMVLVTKPQLEIAGLADRHSGLTKPIADCFAEAARVCLDRHHQSPVDFKINNGHQSIDALTEWDRTDERIRRAWANETDTTELGAYACTLAAVELSVGLVAIHRAETRTGADYYIAPPGTSPEDLEGCVRLEVSGVDRGDTPAIEQRLKVKLKQAAAGQSNLPAMAGVVGFRARLILLAPLEGR